VCIVCGLRVTSAPKFKFFAPMSHCTLHLARWHHFIVDRLIVVV